MVLKSGQNASLSLQSPSVFYSLFHFISLCFFIILFRVRIITECIFWKIIRNLVSFYSDSAASIDTGLKLAGVVWPVRQVESIYNLHRKGGPARECWPPLRCLSRLLSYERERDKFLMVF